MSAIKTFPKSALRIDELQWFDVLNSTPEESGVYLTRNQRDQFWFKYFDAQCGTWILSWSELKNHAPRADTRIDHPRQASQVIAWANAAGEPQQVQAISTVESTQVSTVGLRPLIDHASAVRHVGTKRKAANQPDKMSRINFNTQQGPAFDRMRDGITISKEHGHWECY